MRSLVMMTQADADNVRWIAKREIRFAIGCFVVTVLTTAGLVVIWMAEGHQIVSWHLLFTLACTAFGIGWATKAFRSWSRLQRDLKEMQKEVWTTANVERRLRDVKTGGSTSSKRYELIIDGEIFALPHHRLDELGFDKVRAKRSMTVEASRHGRELLAAVQHSAEPIRGDSEDQAI